MSENRTSPYLSELAIRILASQLIADLERFLENCTDEYTDQALIDRRIEDIRIAEAIINKPNLERLEKAWIDWFGDDQFKYIVKTIGMLEMAYLTNLPQTPISPNKPRQN